MADIKKITPEIDRLEDQLDDLDDALTPLLDGLEVKASQLPLLDRAKLFSLSAYAIETLLFAYLRLEGVNTQDHPVFTELKRVQQYFAKIKSAEQPEASRTLALNQEAAARMLKADLSENKTLRNKLAEKIAEERAKALLKSVESSRKRRADSASSSGTGHEQSQASSRKRNRNESKKMTVNSTL